MSLPNQKDEMFLSQHLIFNEQKFALFRSEVMGLETCANPSNFFYGRNIGLQICTTARGLANRRWSKNHFKMCFH